MGNGGFIKLFRSMLEWEWYEDNNVKVLFLHLLLKANYEEKRWQGITIKRGQLVTSTAKLAEETKLSQQQVRTCMKKLKSTGEITSSVTNKYTIVTLENYGVYQVCENEDNKQSTSKITNNQQTNNNQITNDQQTDNNQITTTKEIKNIRNKELNTTVSNDTVCSKEDLLRIMEQWNALGLNKIVSIKNKRLDLLKVRVKEYGLDSVLQAIHSISLSPHLKGQNKSGWMITFDWFVKPNNFIKVLEGNYIDKKPNGNTGNTPTGNKPNVKQNRFVNFEQRNDWDFDEIERLERENLKKAQGG